MQPTEAPVAPVNHDPYAFIMNPATKPKRGLVGGGDSFVKKILVIVGGAIILIIVLVFLVNIIFGSKGNTAELVSMVQSQQELIRVSQKGTQANNQVTKNVAINTTLGMTTQQKEWIVFLKKYGITVDEKTIILKRDSKTDQRLKSAQDNSTFDIVFTQTLAAQLQAYRTSLQTLYKHTTNTEERDLIRNHFDQIGLLLKQVPADSTTP
jgi:hypothetical protein